MPYSGAVSGALHWGRDSNFRITSETVNGGLLAAFGYDNDGLLTQAGSLTLTPSPSTGLLSGTALGSATDSYTYNLFGEVDSYTAKFGSTTIFSQAFAPRDALGRIA